MPARPAFLRQAPEERHRAAFPCSSSCPVRNDWQNFDQPAHTSDFFNSLLERNRALSSRILGGPQHYAGNVGQRDFGIGAQILRNLGMRDMILLTSSQRKMSALEGFGLRVIARRPIEDDQ